MRRRTLGITAVSAAALGAAAACGSDDGDNAGGDAAEFSGELVIWADEARTPVLKEFVKNFEQEVGVKVTVEEHVETLREDYLTATEQGQGPDIVVGAHDWAGQYTGAGAVTNITLTADQQASLNETAVKAFTVDGNVYGVPYALENLALIRNTDLAPEAPATFEELVEAGKAAGTDEVVMMEVSVNGNAYNAYPLFSSMGGYLFKDDGTGTLDPTDVGVDSPGGVAAFEKFAELGADGVLKTTYDATNCTPFFVDGKTAFLISGPWALTDVQGAGLNYEVTAIPGFEGQGPAAPFLGVQGFYVSSKAKNAVFAQEFVSNYVLTEDLQLKLAEAGGRVPALSAAAETYTAGSTDAQGFAAAGENAVPMPNIPAMDAVWEPFGRAQADAIDGASTGAEAAATAAQTIRDAVGA
jgi:arabinogalactan oligomer / maltooligosaccharide transport system substrate-binding protein